MEAKTSPVFDLKKSIYMQVVYIQSHPNTLCDPSNPPPRQRLLHTLHTHAQKKRKNEKTTSASINHDLLIKQQQPNNNIINQSLIFTCAVVVIAILSLNLFKYHIYSIFLFDLAPFYTFLHFFTLFYNFLQKKNNFSLKK